jgi:hypothetical protein
MVTFEVVLEGSERWTMRFGLKGSQQDEFHLPYSSIAFTLPFAVSLSSHLRRYDRLLMISASGLALLSKLHGSSFTLTTAAVLRFEENLRARDSGKGGMIRNEVR